MPKRKKDRLQEDVSGPEFLLLYVLRTRSAHVSGRDEVSHVRDEVSHVITLRCAQHIRTTLQIQRDRKIESTQTIAA